MVYSLFGLFDIHMPLIYGEGVIKAFRRLAEESEKSSSVNEQCKLVFSNSEYQKANLRSSIDPRRTAILKSFTYDVTIVCCRKWT
jgi:hypothetical protein